VQFSTDYIHFSGLIEMLANLEATSAAFGSNMSSYATWKNPQKKQKAKAQAARHD